MVETRVAPRVRVMKAAKIDYGGDKYPCLVRDISSTGAALELSDLIRIPSNRARQTSEVFKTSEVSADTTAQLFLGMRMRSFDGRQVIKPVAAAEIS